MPATVITNESLLDTYRSYEGMKIQAGAFKSVSVSARKDFEEASSVVKSLRRTLELRGVKVA